MSRALRVPQVIVLLASTFVGLASVGLAQRTDSSARLRSEFTRARPPDTLYIRAAVPSVARRGDTVALQLSDSLPGNATPIRVSIGGFAAGVVAVRASEIVVLVPSKLPSGDTIPRILVYAGTVPTLAFDGLTIVRPSVGPLSLAAAGGLALVTAIR